jgi:hypothetical protein
MYSDMLKVDDVELVESVNSLRRRGKVSDSRTRSNVSEQENVDDEDDDDDDERSRLSIEVSLLVDAVGMAGRDTEERLRTMGEMHGS